MKIAVIFTGGTIGSRTNDKWITVDESTRYDLLKHMKMMMKFLLKYFHHTIY